MIMLNILLFRSEFDIKSPGYAGNETACVIKHWNPPNSGDQNECKWQHLYSGKSILLLSSSVSKLINIWATILPVLFLYYTV